MGMNSPAETTGQLPGGAAEGERSFFPPMWARDGRARRKVVDQFEHRRAFIASVGRGALPG